MNAIKKLFADARRELTEYWSTARQQGEQQIDKFDLNHRLRSRSPLAFHALSQTSSLVTQIRGQEAFFPGNEELKRQGSVTFFYEFGLDLSLASLAALERAFDQREDQIEAIAAGLRED